MKLYEFEGMQLLNEAGIQTPKSSLFNPNEEVTLEGNLFVKAQTMAGGRGKAGLIKKATKQDAKQHVQDLLNQAHKGEPIKKVLIQKALETKNEFYLSILYNTKSRKPTIIVSKEGGVDIEQTKNKVIEETNILEPLTKERAQEIAAKAGIPQIAETILRAYKIFVEKDVKLLEINPLIQTQDDQLIAADAVIILDDDAMFRQEHKFPQRIGTGRQKTQREIAANNISAMDHKGIAGKTFIDLDGDIGIVAIGGGASITAMDALVSYNQKAANYTEYSGNPSAEKVEALTRLVMDIPNLNGFFLVGAKANFTQVDVTIAATLKVIIEKKPTYPIVFRRGGPGEKEAQELVEQAAKEHDLDLTWFTTKTPITVAAKNLAEKVKKYKENKENKQ